MFVLSCMGFGGKWISWINRCVSIAPVSVLVNGSPKPPFYMECGFRQVCSLSSLLFNLVAGTLSILVN